MKKNYIMPEATIVNLYTEACLLDLSKEDDSTKSDGSIRSNERDKSIWGNNKNVWGNSEE